MKLRQRLIEARRKLRITTKFRLAVFVLLLLIAIVAFTGLISLIKVRGETKAAIVTSIEVQRLVFEMDTALREARQLERDFFLRWQMEGFFNAEKDYAQKHRQQIDIFLDTSSQLQELLASNQVSAVLRQRNSDILAYTAKVDEYARSFNEAVGLVSNVGIDDIGYLERLKQNALQLRVRLQLVNDPKAIELYQEMQSSFQEYLSTRQPSEIQSMSLAAQRLRERLQLNISLDGRQRTQILEAIDNYEKVALEVVDVDNKLFNQIIRLDTTVQAVPQKLVDVAKSEIKRAIEVIDITSKWAAVLMIAALIVALVLAGQVMKLFNSALRQHELTSLRLEEERQESERLLLNILPEPIAQRLKRQQTTIADSFAEATVMFADIVGFTELAARSDPIVLVEMLNVIFSEFDQLADEHGLEKIKTIGDAYMVVGGLPVEKPNHTEAIAAMALNMQKCIANYCQETGTDLSIRIGIHTGPVIAGIIGTKKFIYDLWGDTVNIASRMESHGLPGHIQVSEATYKRLNHQYRFQERGLIPVKGRGEMSCYFLLEKYPDVKSSKI